MKTHEALPIFSWSFKSDYLEKKSDELLICIPVILLLALTIPFLSGAYWSDEIFSMQISRSWSVLLDYFRNYESNMSLYYITLHVWITIFGESEFATHCLSLLFALLALPVFYTLARMWQSKSMAMLNVLLLAVNPLFVYYSLEARSYSMLVFFGILSTLFFVRLYRKPAVGLAVFYGLSVVAATYVHYFGILLILVHALTISWRKLTRFQFRFFLISGFIILLGLLPILLFQQKDRSQLAWLTKPDLSYLWYTCKDLVGGGYNFLILLFCMYFVVRKGYWKHAADTEVYLWKLALAWSLVPVLLLYVFSYVEKPVFLPRYFVWCVPGGVLLISVIISHTGWNYKRQSVVWFLLAITMLYRSYVFLHLRGSGYKDAVQYLNETVRPGESVITYPFFFSSHVSYYLDKMKSPNPSVIPLSITNHSYLTGGGGIDPDPDMQLINKLSVNSSKVYVFTTDLWNSPVSDSIQNRSWLPDIEKNILRKHPKKRMLVFGAGTLDPLRVTVYE